MLCMGERKRPVVRWCSGYHVRLTRGRSPVRARVEPVLCNLYSPTLLRNRTAHFVMKIVAWTVAYRRNHQGVVSPTPGMRHTSALAGEYMEAKRRIRRRGRDLWHRGYSEPRLRSRRSSGGGGSGLGGVGIGGGGSSSSSSSSSSKETISAARLS